MSISFSKNINTFMKNNKLSQSKIDAARSIIKNPEVKLAYIVPLHHLKQNGIECGIIFNKDLGYRGVVIANNKVHILPADFYYLNFKELSEEGLPFSNQLPFSMVHHDSPLTYS